eukprot:tig00000270_g23915.t1
MKETSAAVEAAREGVAAALGEGRADELIEMLHRREDALDLIGARCDVHLCTRGRRRAPMFTNRTSCSDNKRVPEAMGDLENVTREEVQALDLSVKFRALEADLSAEGASAALCCGDVDAALADRLLSHYRATLASAGAEVVSGDSVRVDAARLALAPIVSSCEAARPDTTLWITEESREDEPTAVIAPGDLGAVRAALEGLARGAWAPEQCAARLAQLREELIIPRNPPLSDEVHCGTATPGNTHVLISTLFRESYT